MKKIIHSTIIATIFIIRIGFSAEIDKKVKDTEILSLKKTVSDAKKRISSADTYKWKDSLKFLPVVSVSSRSPYEQVNSKDRETYVSASISLNSFFDISDIADRRDAEKRKAVRKVESLGYSIEKLIERKYLITDQVWKMKQIVKSIEDPLEAANRQEKIDQLVLQQNEVLIEIEKLFAEIEYVCVEVEK